MFLYALPDTRETSSGFITKCQFCKHHTGQHRSVFIPVLPTIVENSEYTFPEAGLDLFEKNTRISYCSN